MSLRETLDSALKDAMRARNALELRTLRMAIASIRNAEVDHGSALDDQGVQAILAKEIKSRQESISEAMKAQRDDLVQETQQEIIVLERFLPRQMDDEQLETMVRNAITQSGASTPADLGKVMKLVIAASQGQASGSRINAMVRRLLSG